MTQLGTSNLSSEQIGSGNKPYNVRIKDSETSGEITITWDTVNATGYSIYRSQNSGSDFSDYTKIDSTTSPPYTDTNIEDGEKYYYRIATYY